MIMTACFSFMWCRTTVVAVEFYDPSCWPSASEQHWLTVRSAWCIASHFWITCWLCSFIYWCVPWQLRRFYSSTTFLPLELGLVMLYAGRVRDHQILVLL